MSGLRTAALAAITATILGGCSMESFELPSIGGEGTTAAPGTAQKAAELPPAPQPIYAANDTYVFNQGGALVQEKVVSVSPDRAVWTNDSGLIWTTGLDVITPPLSWSSNPELGRGRQTIVGSPGEIFPLREGNVAAFIARGNSELVPTGWQDEQRCVVKGQETVSVSAGEFSTYRIECSRKDYLETIFYAPVIQHYALRIRKFNNAEDRKELVAVELSNDRTKDMPMKVENAPMAPEAKPMMAGDNSKPMGDSMAPASHDDKPMMGGPEDRLSTAILRLEMVVNKLERIAIQDTSAASMGMKDKAPTMMAATDGKYGAHLASYRTDKGAKSGWRKLQKKYPDELGNMSFRTTEFDAGDGRGGFVRLVAASFKTQQDAASFCRALRGKRQFCKPVRIAP